MQDLRWDAPYWLMRPQHILLHVASQASLGHDVVRYNYKGQDQGILDWTLKSDPN